jgi:hypothetical protein
MKERTSTALELCGLALLLISIGTLSPQIAAGLLGLLLIAAGYQGSNNKR